MTIEETAELLAYFRVMLPQPGGKELTDKDVEQQILGWYGSLAEYDYRIVKQAGVMCVNTCQFFPTVKNVLEKIAMLTNPDRMSEGEAWALVEKAAANSGYRAQEEFDALPPEIRRIVGSPRQLYEWGMMPSDEFHSVVASNFQRSYRVLQTREQEMAMLPPSAREVAKAIAAGVFKQLPEETVNAS